MPKTNQEADFIARTANARGYMHALNEMSKAFIAYAPHAQGLVVDIGAAFGIATIPVIEQHVDIVACDIEAKHLQHIKNTLPYKLRRHLNKKIGKFPNEIDFKKNSVGAILLSHILVFLTPNDLDEAFEKLGRWVKPGGKVFTACYTSYTLCFKRFIPIYEQRLAQGIKWPCWVKNNVKDYLDVSQEIRVNIPDTLTYIDKQSLIDALIAQQFSIEKADYLDAEKNHIPELLLMDGREWVGIIAIKQ